MADIYPYSSIAPVPTTEAVVHWIDRRPDADGSEQTIRYGTDPTELEATASTPGDCVPAADPAAYRYSVHLRELSPGTTYHVEIDGKIRREYRTLPENATDDDLTVVLYSDLHITSDTGMPDPDGMVPIRDQDTDLLLFAGDYLGEFERSQQVAADYIRLFRDYYGVLNETRLHPVFPVPGNHDVGYWWRGGTDTGPASGYFQFFYPVVANEIGPQGENYGQVTVGNSLQLLGLDTVSATPSDVAEWMASAIDPEVAISIPFYHVAMLPGHDRPKEDHAQERMRAHWIPEFARRDNVPVQFNGHFHLRKHSVPYDFVDSPPESDRYFEIPDGFVTSTDRDEGMLELNVSYRDDNHEAGDYWWTDISERGVKNFYTLSITDERVEVTEKDAAGGVPDTVQTRWSYTFDLGAED